VNFGQALEAMKQGKKAKRKHWGGYWFIGYVEIREPIPYTKWSNIDSTQMIIARLKDGGYVPATPYQEDLLAEDWEVIE
jgi:Protein of unknown function (DUF2829)